ncbi:MAG TPA: ATP-dependent DNA ligase [Glaciihabitans sp.]|jgi:hypothetical protein|nr:ATP-dependent DNA ligase [Glaciihabitans sp.]
MGTLTYNGTFTVDFDDRVLAHLQVVIGAKLRRGESFYFSWKDDARIGNGRTTIWIHPTVPMIYKYFGGKMPMLNRLWIDALVSSANSSGGLQLVTEPTGNEGENGASA